MFHLHYMCLQKLQEQQATIRETTEEIKRKLLEKVKKKVAF